jgi:hypothetical protein
MTFEMEEQGQKPPRATRHLLQVPLRFRPAGHTDWRDGLTENISQSGVLFRSDLPVNPQTEVELLLSLGSGNPEGAATLLCRGRVVRTEPARGDDPRSGIAATISCRQAYMQGNDPRRI